MSDYALCINFAVVWIDSNSFLSFVNMHFSMSITHQGKLLKDNLVQLEKAIQSLDSLRIEDMLRLFLSFGMTRPLLTLTNAPKVIGRLRKHEKLEISELAKEIVSKWKSIAYSEPSCTIGGSSSASTTPPAVLTRPTRTFRQTFTITFGDRAENHVGMQVIGKLAEHGFSLDDLRRAQAWFSQRDVVCEMVPLHNVLTAEFQTAENEAYILIARQGLNCLLSGEPAHKTADAFFDEQNKLVKDKHALMYGRVVNKIARHNLCFSDEDQEPDYGAGKGRVVAFSKVPLLTRARNSLAELLGPVGASLAAEGNYYYDPEKCGIGFHGDSERRKVIGVRVGATLPLHFLWFQQGRPISRRVAFKLNHGDVYFFTEKAAGSDWKRKKSVPTIRHAAGADKFLQVKKE